MSHLKVTWTGFWPELVNSYTKSLMYQYFQSIIDRMLKTKWILYFLFINCCKTFASSNEIEVHQPNATSSFKSRSQHSFAKFWPFLSIIGVIGTSLNSYVLYSFYSVRAEMVSSVNIMIGWYDYLFHLNHEYTNVCK